MMPGDLLQFDMVEDDELRELLEEVFYNLGLLKSVVSEKAYENFSVEAYKLFVCAVVDCEEIDNDFYDYMADVNDKALDEISLDKPDELYVYWLNTLMFDFIHVTDDMDFRNLGDMVLWTRVGGDIENDVAMVRKLFPDHWKIPQRDVLDAGRQ